MAKVEIQRHNVTVAEFLSYVKRVCKAKGTECDIDKADFEKPAREYMISYTIINGKKHIHEAYYQTETRLVRKHTSYTIPGGLTRYRYTDEFDEVEEKKLVYNSYVRDADEDAPCKAETIRMFAHDFQTYVLNFDGTRFNEICEFTFTEDGKGYGYYYREW